MLELSLNSAADRLGKILGRKGLLSFSDAPVKEHSKLFQDTSKIQISDVLFVKPETISFQEANGSYKRKNLYQTGLIEGSDELLEKWNLIPVRVAANLLIPVRSAKEIFEASSFSLKLALNIFSFDIRYRIGTETKAVTIRISSNTEDVNVPELLNDQDNPLDSIPMVEYSFDIMTFDVIEKTEVPTLRQIIFTENQGNGNASISIENDA